MTIARPAARRPPRAGFTGRRRMEPAELTDEQLAARLMSPLARCADAALDPDEWFPISSGAEAARAEATGALALCSACPVRAECLEVAMRRWHSIGRHGIWGGLVEADRAAAHRRWLAGMPVETLLGPAAPVSRRYAAPGGAAHWRAFGSARGRRGLARQVKRHRGDDDLR